MENLRLLAKHESYATQNLRNMLGSFLLDCGERICVLKTIHTRIVNRLETEYHLSVCMSVCHSQQVRD